jgi:hypothetical protein
MVGATIADWTEHAERNCMWQQVCNPFNHSVLSTIAAAVPVVTLLVLIATGAVKTHLALICPVARRFTFIAAETGVRR